MVCNLEWINNIHALFFLPSRSGYLLISAMFKLQRKLRAASCFMQYGGGANLCTGLDSQVEDDESAPPRGGCLPEKGKRGKEKQKTRRRILAYPPHRLG